LSTTTLPARTAADAAVPVQPAAADAGPELPAAEAAGQPADRGGQALVVGAVGGGVLLSIIGLSGSYTTLRVLAEHAGLGVVSWAFPVGVDLGILVLLALDLALLTRFGRSVPLLRFGAYLLTGVTIYLNASVGLTCRDMVIHAALPILWILVVEAARYYVATSADAEAGRPGRSIPLLRWLLAPVSTARLWRRMKLWDLDSYSETVELYRQHVIYRQHLRQLHGKRWRRDAPADARLPVTLWPLGLGVEEALAIPAHRASAERDRAQAEADRVLAAELAEADREQQRMLARIASEGTARLARARAAAAAAEVDRAAAEADAAAVRDRAVADAVTGADLARITAEGSAAARAAAAEVEARAGAAAEQAAAEQRAEAARIRQQAAEAEHLAADQERKAADDRRAAADTEALRARAEEEDAAARQRAAAEAAEAERLRAEAALAAADAEQQAADARRRAAEDAQAAADAELAAAEADALARLTPSEREARAIARALAGGKSVTVKQIEEKYGVSQPTASARLARARQLLDDGGGQLPPLLPRDTPDAVSVG